MTTAPSRAIRQLVLLVAVTLCLLPVGSKAAATTTNAPALPPPFAKGQLVKLDLINKQLTLKLKDGPHTFILTERTYIFRGKEKITPDKLKINEIIALNFYADDAGRAFVRRIKAPEPAAPAEADADKKLEPPNPP